MPRHHHVEYDPHTTLIPVLSGGLHHDHPFSIQYCEDIHVNYSSVPSLLYFLCSSSIKVAWLIFTELARGQGKVYWREFGSPGFEDDCGKMHVRANTGVDWIHVRDTKVHEANMGPTRVLSAPDGPHVIPMNLSIRVVVTQYIPRIIYKFRALLCVVVVWQKSATSVRVTSLALRYSYIYSSVSEAIPTNMGKTRINSLKLIT